MSDNMIIFPILANNDLFCQYLEKRNIEIIVRTEIGVLVSAEDKCIFELSDLRQRYFEDEDQHHHVREIRKAVDETMKKLKAAGHLK